MLQTLSKNYAGTNIQNLNSPLISQNHSFLLLYFAIRLSLFGCKTHDNIISKVTKEERMHYIYMYII
jgi:hypothetical protein